MSDIIEPDRLRAPIVIAAFEGWNDAADAATDALRFLIRSLHAREVFELDAQDYHDFQSARPHVTLHDGVVTAIGWRSTSIAVARTDRCAHDFILVLGVEPNLRWPQFCEEILSYAEIQGAAMVVTLGALLGDTPHTRTLPITGTASSAELVARLGLERSRYEGPTGIVGVLADAARRSGFETVSLWAPVPHYAAAAPSPKATLTLLERLADLVGVDVELANLGVMARGWQASIDSFVETNGDLTAYVHQLEARYDSDLADDDTDVDLTDDDPFDSLLDDLDFLFDTDDDDDDDDDEWDEEWETDGAWVDERGETVTDDALPNGDALAEDFERYLRDRRNDDEPPPEPQT